MPARTTTHSATKLWWVTLSLLALVLSLLTPGVSNAATTSPSGLTGPGLVPIDTKPGGLPASDSCGVDGYGTYVKFTTGGGTTPNGAVNPTAGQKASYSGTYASDEAAGLFQLKTLVDANGAPVWFDTLVGGATSDNPIWTFAPTTAPSPVLGLTPELAAAGANFSQFALCVYPNVTFAVTKAVVAPTDLATTQTFPVTWTCSLGTTTWSGTATLRAGETTAPITVPKGAECSATDAAAGYTTTGSGKQRILANGATLTVTNTRTFGSLVVRKDQVGGVVQQWDFTVRCRNAFDETFAGSLEVLGNSTGTLSGIPTGLECTVTETASDLFVAAPQLVQKVTIPTDATATASVTFTNTRKTGSITVAKVQDGGVTQPFTFTVSCADKTTGETFTGTLTVRGGESGTLSGIPTGLACTVTEASSDLFTADQASKPFTLDNAQAATAKVTFTNTRNTGSIAVTKKQVGGVLQPWTFDISCASPSGSTYPETFTGSIQVQANATASLSGIPTGLVCTVTEKTSDLFVADPAQQQVTIPVTGDSTASVTFTNTRRLGSLTVTKNQVGGDAQPWDFVIGCAKGDEKYTTTVRIVGSGSTTLTDIPTDLTCTVTETQAGAMPFDTTSTNRTVVIDPTTPAQVTFTNTKRASVAFTKTANGLAPDFVYTFTLTGGDVSKTLSTTPGQVTPLDFGLVKPGTYQLCEQQVAAGTTPTLAGLPGATTDPLTGTVCATITLDPGQSVATVLGSTTIDNRIGEGGRRTIGYWKNWSSCGGTAGQLANAARTGKKLLDDVLPLTLGGYTVPGCKTGVAILSSAAGKYAENQLAAQLLAAKANVAVAGSAPQTVLDAIAHADALLTQIGYKGAPSSIVGSTHPLRADVVATATLLDNFNNGRLG